ncbi:F-box/LRR-repeat protein At5g63520-like isoform X2 [Chenopodium quinoa]|uniref:F-box/LRR-repeat protein At5g63520-like isoform X2 n=1 Tax=Chenopodium quinoa TaxID=63459 RepID=UPI000B7720F0|nr:F-box/LRR-repeat protein At5g63520-like isoform X2 [Chenopodium quinoa]
MDNPPKIPCPIEGAEISELDDFLLQKILSKLPAKNFASAACVSRDWNDICSRILVRPKLLSVFSLNTSLREAVNEVTEKVLSEPIRPDFAILSICHKFDLDDAHKLITEKLGTKIPIVTCDVNGIIGRDAETDCLKEVMFPNFDDDADHDDHCPLHNGGISLTIGYLPSLKVGIISLPKAKQGGSIDKFVMDLRRFSASVSGLTSPEAIIMFGDSQAHMKPVLEKLDYALSKKTVIAGNEICSFRHSSIDTEIISTHRGQESSYDAVALVFAMERTTFGVGAGVTAVGPTYQVVSAKRSTPDFTTWLTAKREGENEILDGEGLLNAYEMEMGNLFPDFDLHIGIRKRRKYSIGSEQARYVKTVAYHPVQEGDDHYLYVGGLDIKTGDKFRYYIPDKEYALDSCATVSENFGKLKDKDIIGGLVFSCCGRGDFFFEKPNVDSSPILDNFPNIPLAGIFCGTEIGRGFPNLGQEEASESLLHAYSSIYLLLSYIPPTPRP